MPTMAVYRQVQVLSSQLGREVVLLEPHSDRVAYTNASAAMIYQLCDGERTESEIVELLAEAYPEAAEQIPTQVSAVLEQLLSAGMLERVR